MDCAGSLWEPEDVSVLKETEALIEPKSLLPSEFRMRVGKSGKIRLANLPLNCEEQVAKCAQLRVALYPESHRPFLSALTQYLLLLSAGIVLLTGLIVYAIAKWLLLPISVLSGQLEQSAAGKQIVLDSGKNQELGSAVEIVALQKSLTRFVSVLESSSRDAAVASTTQALAHDIRKPFTMFQMIIDAVEHARDVTEAREFLREALPEVQQAIASVNGMISDVLEVGAQAAPNLEATNVESLIEAKLNQIFRIYRQADISITYQLKHNHKVLVDTLKIGRVLANLVGNAIQAMNYNGRIWINTEEIFADNKPFLRFCLGNSDSFIPKETIDRLFNAFFTSGKKGGTGLGLAIAKKIVSAHGGMIWCESDKIKGTEFYFTLLLAQLKTDSRDSLLPLNSKEVAAVFERFTKSFVQNPVDLEQQDFELALENDVLQGLSSLKRPLGILIVDDEGVYRNSLAAVLNKSEEIRSHCKIEFAHNADQGIQVVSGTEPIHLVILDVDLGSQSINGYEALRAMRKQGFAGVVCIHSNRSLPGDYRDAMEAGADAVLPKPMGRAHLFKLMLQAFDKV